MSYNITCHHSFVILMSSYVDLRFLFQTVFLYLPVYVWFLVEVPTFAEEHLKLNTKSTSHKSKINIRNENIWEKVCISDGDGGYDA